MRAAGILLAMLLAASVPGVASAQVWMSGPASAPRAGSWELGGGALWAQGFELGDRTATLTRNPTTGSGAFSLFTADSRLEPAPAGQARLGFYLARVLSLEGGVQYSRPVLRTRLANDAEGAASITASETITRYVLDGSLVVHLVGLSFAGGRGVPFVLGGGGYIRELHQGNELVETGRQIHAGGGLKFWFGSGRRRAGLRAEAGVALRDGGFDLAEDRRTMPTAGVSVLYLF